MEAGIEQGMIGEMVAVGGWFAVVTVLEFVEAHPVVTGLLVLVLGIVGVLAALLVGLWRRQYRHQVLFETLFNNNAAGLSISVGEERRFERVNDEMSRILGYEEAALLGKTVYELTHEDDRAEDERARLRFVADPEAQVRLRKRLVRKDGETVWVLVRARRLPPSIFPDGKERILATVLDVSPEEALREELSEVSRRHRLAMETGEIGIWDYNVQTEELYWDDQMLRIFGVAKEDFWPMLTTWEQSVVAEDRGREKEKLARAVSEKVPYDGEFRIRRAGEVRSIKAWGEPVLTADGDVERMIGINYDITELRRTEAALRVSEQQFRSIAEGAPLGVYFMGRHGELRWSNQRLLEILGRSWEELAGKGWQDFLHEEDRRRVLLDWDREHAADAVLEARFRLRRGDGSYCTIHRRAAPIVNADGEVEGFTAVMEDITEKHALERELREARESLELAQRLASMGSWRYDPRTGGTWWSRELFRIVGRPPSAGAPTPEEYLAMVEAEDRGRLRHAMEESYRSGQFACRFRIRRVDDGQTRHVQARGVVRWNSDWEPIEQVGFMQDITQEHEHEAALEEAREKAERANRAKSEFLAVMNHELRTPLNSIIGPLEILESMNSDPESATLLELVSSSSRHLLELINSVLDLARIESGRMEAREEEIELREFVVERLGPLRARAESKGLSFYCEYGEGVPEKLVTDSRMLAQILFNLVGNAVKFTEAGEVGLRWERDGAWLHCAVEDSGPGIAAGERERIFEPFEQVDMSYARRHGGTGLGLSITRSLLETLGGKICVRSEEGKGSCFCFQLPLRVEEPANGADAGTEAAVAVAEGKAVNPLRGLPVLLVEDNPYNLRAMEVLLRRLEVDFQSVESGQAALDILAGRSFAVILLDIALPDLDGVEVARRIRELSGKGGQRIIAQTAFSLEQERERFLAEGMDGCLAKPVTLESLRACLEESAGVVTERPICESGNEVDS